MGVLAVTMSLAQTLVSNELANRKGEIDTFRRLQERISECDELKAEKASLVSAHQQELSVLQSQMSDALAALEAERIQQIELKDCSIAELRDVVDSLTSEPGMVVDQIRRAYVNGVRSPSKLRPPRLTEPVFRPVSKMPELIPEAFLSQFDYAKLKKIVKSSN